MSRECGGRLKATREEVTAGDSPDRDPSHGLLPPWGSSQSSPLNLRDCPQRAGKPLPPACTLGQSSGQASVPGVPHWG